MRTVRARERGGLGQPPSLSLSLSPFLPARAQRRAQLLLVLGQALDDDGGDGLVHAEEGVGAMEWSGGGGRNGEMVRAQRVFFFPSAAPLTGQARPHSFPQAPTHRLAHCSENLRIISTVLGSTGLPVRGEREGAQQGA